MATARLGGFSPEIGFLAFMTGSVAFAFFGASRYLSAGADSTIAPIFAGALTLIAASGSQQYAGLAVVLAIMVGMIVCAGGLLRLGWIADLLSTPVMAGFLAGIAVHIAISQLPGLLGLAPGTGNVFHRLGAIASDVRHVNPFSVMIGIGAFFIIFLAERINVRIPGALIAIALATLAVTVFDLPSHGVAVLGAFPVALPKFTLPDITFEDMRVLVPLALLIAVVVMMQTAATTRAFGSGDREPNINRDFVGIGAASLFAGMVGAFPVNASPPRTALAVETGGRSQLTGLFAAAIVLAVVLFGGKLLANVPEATLAGILLFVAQRLLHWQTFAGTFRRARGEFLLILVTIGAIIALPIEVGVTIGIGLSLLHGIWSITQVNVIEFEKVPGTSIWWPPAAETAGEHAPGILVAAFQAPLSFVNAERFKHGFHDIIGRSGKDLKHVIFEASSIIDIDYTAAQALGEVIAHCQILGISFSIARMESVRVQAALVRFGIASKLGPNGIFRSVDDAVITLNGTGGATKAA